MININDPSAWQSLDWDEPISVKIKSDTSVNRARSALGKKNSLEFGKTMSVIAQERNLDSNYRKNLKQGCEQRDNNYQALSNARPEVQAKISAKMSKHVKTAEHEAKVAASNAAKPTDPNWKAALMSGLAKRDRPFHTPYGVFASLNAAARYVTENNLLTNAVKKFEKWKLTDPTNYYFEEKQ